MNGQKLATKDGFGIWDTTDISIISNQKSTKILLMEVPMSM